MVRDGERCKRRGVHDSTTGGPARLWFEGGRSRPFLIEEEEKGCGPTSPGYGTLMVMSQGRPGRGSRFLGVTAPNRRTASWLRRRHI